MDCPKLTSASAEIIKCRRWGRSFEKDFRAVRPYLTYEHVYSRYDDGPCSDYPTAFCIARDIFQAFLGRNIEDHPASPVLSPCQAPSRNEDWSTLQWSRGSTPPTMLEDVPSLPRSSASGAANGSARLSRSTWSTFNTATDIRRRRSPDTSLRSFARQNCEASDDVDRTASWSAPADSVEAHSFTAAQEGRSPIPSLLTMSELHDTRPASEHLINAGTNMPGSPATAACPNDINAPPTLQELHKAASSFVSMMSRADLFYAFDCHAHRLYGFSEPALYGLVQQWSRKRLRIWFLGEQNDWRTGQQEQNFRRYGIAFLKAAKPSVWADCVAGYSFRPIQNMPSHLTRLRDRILHHIGNQQAQLRLNAVPWSEQELIELT